METDPGLAVAVTLGAKYVAVPEMPADPLFPACVYITVTVPIVVFLVTVTAGRSGMVIGTVTA